MTSPAPTAPPAPLRSPPSPPPARTPPRRATRTLRRRRRRALALAAAVTALVALVVTAVDPVRDGLGRLVPSGGSPSPAAPRGTLMLAWPTTEDGGAVIVLLGGPADAALLVPGGTQVEVPSFGSQTLAGAFRTAGPDTLALAFENALGYDVGEAVGLDAAGLTELFGAAAPLEVRLRRPVRVGDDAFPATPLRLGAADAVRLATTRPDEATEFDHLVVVHALLEALLARVPSDAPATLRELAGRDVSFDTLDVVSLGVPGAERYALDGGRAGAEMARLFPGLAFGDGTPRLRVEVLNGTGRAGLATEVAERVVPLGVEVVLTGNAGTFGVEETVVVLQDPRFEARARALVEALGAGELRMARNPVGVADVSIVIGSDFDPGGG